VKRKYRLANWIVVCQSKYQEGLGIHDLEVKNRNLIAKWLFKLILQDWVWKTLLKKKISSKGLYEVYLKHAESLFLGWSNGDEEILLLLWIIFN
jgi:hypothetical protein